MVVSRVFGRAIFARLTKPTLCRTMNSLSGFDQPMFSTFGYIIKKALITMIAVLVQAIDPHLGCCSVAP